MEKSIQFYVGSITSSLGMAHKMVMVVFKRRFGARCTEDTVSEFSGVRAPVLCHCFGFSPTNSCETILSSLQTHFHLHFTLFVYSPHEGGQQNLT